MEREQDGGAVRVADPARRWVRTGQVVSVLALAGACWWFLAEFAERHGFFDLKVYYGAINWWVAGDGEIYDFLRIGTPYGFTYPPFAALAMLPMAWVPFWAAIVVSVTASVLVTFVLLDRLLAPVVEARGWPRWYTLAVAVCLVAVFEPMRETINFGQVNVLLLGLVAVDLLVFIPRRRRFGGAAIGLATAIKLTPGLFIVHLLVTKRWRPALVACLAAGAATLAAAAVIPDASREFWTDAVWNTSRVGSLAFISNQSLNGAVARLDPTHPSKVLWLAVAGVVVAVWVWRIRRAAAAGDLVGELALTGVAGCLLSPITWVHHLVWLLPALIRMFEVAMIGAGPVSGPGAGAGPWRWRRAGWLALTVALFALLSSRLVWYFSFHFGGWGLLGANAYVWASLVLLVVMPLRAAAPAGSAPVGSGPAVAPDPAVRAQPASV